MLADFQICISVPLNKLVKVYKNKTAGIMSISRGVASISEGVSRIF